MKRRYDEDAERAPLPDVWKFVIALIAIVSMYITANKVTDSIYEHDVLMYDNLEYVQYNEENV